MRGRCIPLLLASALALPGVGAQAAPVSYGFTGTVWQDDLDRGWTGFSGSFVYDSAAIDSIADASTASYAHAGAPWGFSLVFDGGDSLAIDDQFFVNITNDLLGEDQFGVLALAADGSSLQLTLWDLLGTVFSSDALPTAPLSLANFGDNGLAWDTAEGRLAGRLDTLSCSSGCSTGTGPEPEPEPPQAVPEPGSLALVLAGLGAAGVWRRQRLG